MAKATKEINYYFIVLNRCLNQLFCPNCNISILPKHFEKHAFQEHGINGKTTCVWCERVSWASGKKYKHKNHLLSCFKKLMQSQRYERSNNDPLIKIDDVEDFTQFNTDSDLVINVDGIEDFIQFNRPHDTSPDPLDDINIQPYRLLKMTHEFPEKQFFDHLMTHPDPMIETLEEFLNAPLCPLPAEILPPLPVSFPDENLNLAASCVLFYLETGNTTHDFFHVMIRLPVAETFRQVMEQQDQVYTLPFSCWCDGGTYREPLYRQHRHLIVVSFPKNHFKENVWPRVKLPEGIPPPKPKYPCKRLKTIDSSMHLVNTIGYLSKRRSKCNFSFKKLKKRFQNNHFYLYKTLPVNYKLPLVLLWPNGVLELLKQTKFQNVSVAQLAQSVLTHDGRQWSQLIKDFPNLERGTVVRVAAEYVPTNAITPHFLHLAGDRKLYFEKSPENRNLEARVWCQKQIDGGNSFYDAVGESEWIPKQRDQKILNFHKPAIDRIRELESKVERLEKTIKTLESQNREKEEAIQSQFREKDKKIKTLESQLAHQIIQCKDEEIARLRLENDRQKRKIDRLCHMLKEK